MKKIFVILAVVLAVGAFFAFAQSGVDPISKMEERLRSYDAIETAYRFIVTNKEGKVVVDEPGTFYQEGECFLVKSFSLDIYCDGKSKMIYNHMFDEITIIGHDPRNGNMSENPFVVLTDTKANYTYVFENDKVVLTPKNGSADHTSVEIVLSPNDFSIKSITYFAPSGSYRAEVQSLRGVDKKGGEFYTINLDEVSDDVVINDLR